MSVRLGWQLFPDRRDAPRITPFGQSNEAHANQSDPEPRASFGEPRSYGWDRSLTVEYRHTQDPEDDQSQCLSDVDNPPRWAGSQLNRDFVTGEPISEQPFEILFLGASELAIRAVSPFLIERQRLQASAS